MRGTGGQTLAENAGHPRANLFYINNLWLRNDRSTGGLAAAKAAQFLAVCRVLRRRKL